MIVQPQSRFPVVRQLSDPSDGGTYYVQAVVRKYVNDTEAVVDTLNLTNQGGQRFSKYWQTPADPSGEGLYISIVTTVYTDPAYTVKSDVYGLEETTYLIANRLTPLQRAGGGGIDVRTMRRVMQEEIAKAKPDDTAEKKPKAAVKAAPARWDDILSAIDALKEAIPKAADPVDFAPVMQGLDALSQAIEAKEVTPATDLTPVLQAIADLKDSCAHDYEEFTAKLEEFAKTAPEAIIKAVHAGLAQIIQGATFTIAPTMAKMNLPAPQKEEKGIPFDLHALAQ